jgi:hypothetical protein
LVRAAAAALVVLSAALVPPPAHAQATRDAEFARILLQKGFVDLAESEARRIEGDAGYAEAVRGDAGYLLARVLKARASQDPSQAPDLLDEMGRLIEELKRKYPTHQMSAIADLEQLQVRLKEAETRLAKAEGEADAAKAAEERVAAVTIFDEVLAQFEAVITEMNQRLEKSEDEDLIYKRDLAEYLFANAYFTYGKALVEGSEDRKAAFTQSRDKFQSFFDERGDFFNLQVLAFLGLGKAQLELGQYEDAGWTFTDAVEVEVPFEHPDPDMRREMQQFVDDAKAEAYFWMLTAHVRAKQYQDALEGWRSMDERFSEGKTTHFGKLSVLMYGKALAGLGRYGEAGDAIAEVLEASMKSENLIPGYDIDPYGVSASKTLAEISEGYTGFFPAPLQFRAGQGFIFKREFEKATYALKGVLAASATDAEREQWGPLALMDLAAAYDRLSRPIDAALAYQGLYRLFPDAANADTAMKLSKQRYMALEEVDQKGFYKALADEVTDDMQRTLRGIGVEKIKYNRGVESQKLGRYVEAAGHFERVEREIQFEGRTIAVDFYGKALANAGYCWYMAARQERARQRAERHEEKAREALNRALAFGEETGDQGAQAAAAYFLALIASAGDEQEASSYEGALAQLAKFDGTLKQDRAYRDKALGQMVHCHVMLAARGGDVTAKQEHLSRAERRYAELTKQFPGSEEATIPAFEIGDAYAKLSREHAKAAAADDAGRALRKAARFLKQWLDASERVSFGQRVWVGGMLLRTASYAEAAEVLGAAVAQAETDGVSDSQKEQMTLEYAKIELAASLVKSGDITRALQRLDEAAQVFSAAGKDPTDDFLYAKTRDDALYRRWQKSQDVRELAELKTAHESYWAVLDALGEVGWEDMTRTYNLPVRSFYVADKEAAARSLEIQLGLKQWRFVHSQIAQMLESGALDDLVRRKIGGDVTGMITEEGQDAVTVKKADGSTEMVPRSEVRVIERFPKELREKFRAMLDKAKQEGNL